MTGLRNTGNPPRTTPGASLIAAIPSVRIYSQRKAPILRWPYVSPGGQLVIALGWWLVTVTQRGATKA